MRKNVILTVVGVLCVFVIPLWAAAAEQYLLVPLDSLKQIKPEKPATAQINRIGWWSPAESKTDSPDARAYLFRSDRRFSASVLDEDKAFSKEIDAVSSLDRETLYLVVRTSGKAPAKIAYRVPNRDADEPEMIIFALDWDKLYSAEQDKLAMAAFLLCQQDYYTTQQNGPGAPFFAHLAREAQEKLNAEFGLKKSTTDRPAAVRGTNMSVRSNTSLVRSFDLLSGSRAIEQNLELDAMLTAWKQEKRTVSVADIAGISVAEIDWEPHIKDLPETKLDRLASLVPADQHIVVFPNFQAAFRFAKLTEQSGIPVLQFLNYRDASLDKRTFQRYQRQLGLSLDSLVEKLGPALIDSVAVTGGDMYFPTGTDITILFETKNAAVLRKLLEAQAVLQFGTDVESIETKEYTGHRNSDRTVSAYFAKIDANTVAVSNSAASLERIFAVRDKETASLAGLDEYRFFRNRYQVGDASESAFAFLSDATIRRWCGPQWRIAASRRLWQQAVLGRLQAEHAGDIINENIKETKTLAQGTQAEDKQLETETQYRLTPGGVVNAAFGTYQFLTPIAEMKIGNVSEEERRAYDQWRNEYEGLWRRNFDPIGIRITLGEKIMASDVTVMPINVRTNREFSQFFGFSAGAGFASDESVYGTPLQAIMSINIDSQQFRTNANLAEQMAGGVSLGWIGKHATVFFDDDAFWGELLEVIQKGDDSPVRFLLEEGNLSRLPVGVEVASNNPLKLTMFLAALRGIIEQTAPGLTQWETLQYRDVGYVKISPRESDNSLGLPENFAVYYTPANGRLMVTLSENLLKRHIDRRIDAQPEASSESQPPQWSGENLALRLDERAIPMLDRLYMLEMPAKIESSAWQNVPVMEEYKRRFPDKSPVDVHERLWGERLFCPNGGTYEWNETWQAFEPKLGELPTASPIAAVKNADLGVTFENDGIRAKVKLELK